MITLLDKTYSGGEELGQDVEEDVNWALWNDPEFKDIPVDEYNFQTGTFRVTITWEPDDDDDA